MNKFKVGDKVRHTLGKHIGVVNTVDTWLNVQWSESVDTNVNAENVELVEAATPCSTCYEFKQPITKREMYEKLVISFYGSDYHTQLECLHCPTCGRSLKDKFVKVEVLDCE